MKLHETMIHAMICKLFQSSFFDLLWRSYYLPNFDQYFICIVTVIIEIIMFC